jgi:hypothetical protein
MANLQSLTINDTGFLTLPSGTTAQRPTAVAGMIRYNTSDSAAEYYNNSLWIGGTYSVKPGLAGKFFNGTWRNTVGYGFVGTLPLTTANDSSNVTGTGGLPSPEYRYGVNVWTSIDYNTLGDNYGFIAIGYFTPPTTGTYTFATTSDDGSGVWIGTMASSPVGRSPTNAVVNNGLGAGQGSTKRSGTIDLTAGVIYPIRVVHEEIGGGDNLQLAWSGPSIAETTNLATYFTTRIYLNKFANY